jgi:hypothetical protein
MKKLIEKLENDFEYGPVYHVFSETLALGACIYPMNLFRQNLDIFQVAVINKKNIRTRILNDIYMLFELFLIFVFFRLQISNSYFEYLIWYLLLTKLFYNLHFLFMLKTPNLGIHDAYYRSARKIYVVIFSFFLTILYFSLIYRCFDLSELGFRASDNKNTTYIMFSLSNALGIDSGNFNNLSNCVLRVRLVQVIITAIYVTLLFSRNMPQSNQA